MRSPIDALRPIVNVAATSDSFIALEQLLQHFRDLEQWVTEWARLPKVAQRERKG
jgi:hypothetical protein